MVVREDIESIVTEPLRWDAFSGANILVSGGAGFVPAYMVETFLYLNECVLQKPCVVTIMVRNLDRAKNRFEEYKGNPYLKIWHEDVCCLKSSHLEMDYIIHAASSASPTAYKNDPTGTILPNVLGTRNLLNAAYGHSKGLLFFSSGEASVSLDPLDLRSCYGESKRMGETMCVAWAHQFGIPAKIVRLGHTYGPRMRLDDGRVFADFVKDILRGGPIVLLSDGKVKRSFCYLSDAVAGIFTVLLNGKVGEAYNVSNPDQYVSIRELAERLQHRYSEHGMRLERRERTDSNYLQTRDLGSPMSIDKMLALGWSPKIAIEEGFERTVRSYSEVRQ